MIEPAIYVSPNQSLEELAPLLREREEQMAIVFDEYGSAIGTITMEDVVEASERRVKSIRVEIDRAARKTQD